MESEQMYVSDLEQVHKYITYMRESKESEDADIPMPDELREGRDRMIFGNIESIFEWHREWVFFSKCLITFWSGDEQNQLYLTYTQLRKDCNVYYLPPWS